jgi:hypothetical protein
VIVGVLWSVAEVDEKRIEKMFGEQKKKIDIL